MLFKRIFMLILCLALNWPLVASASASATDRVIPGSRMGGVVQAANTARPQVALAGQGVSGGEYLQVVLGLFLVVGLIIALAWVARRFGRFSVAGAGALRILGGLSIGQRERVVLIQVGEQQILLGVAPGRVQTLHVLAQPITPPAANTGSGHGGASGSGPRFAERLSAVLKRGPRP